MGFPIPAERLIPHRLPMRLIETLESCNGESGTLLVRSGAAGLLEEEDGTLAPVAFLELIAQSFAALQGYRDLLSGQPVRRGFLVGVHHMEFHGRAGTEGNLRVSVRVTARFAEFAVAEGRVESQGRLVAEGSLKLWIAPAEETAP